MEPPASMILLKDTHTGGVGNNRSWEMVNVIGPNYRKGVNAGRASLFAPRKIIFKGSPFAAF
jgi:hypothetical protein